MTHVKEFIESGMLEMYVLGQTTPEETKKVEEMAALYEEVHTEINDINITLERFARANAKVPNPTIQPMLMAKIDYMNRMKNGEKPAFPPMLHSDSKVSDYAEWLDRHDLQPVGPVQGVYASIIGFTPQVFTSLVWLKEGAPPETHTDELEKFLIVEGTCDITIGSDVHSLKPGDVLMIPLHIPHHVKVTSNYPCKIILQRVAA